MPCSSAGHPGFQAKYLDMLRAGGTKRHRELLAPFGLDASDPAFWQHGPRRHRRLHRRAGGAPDGRTRPTSGASLFGELRRFARTSGAVGGIAARVAGERVFGIRTDRAAHAEDLQAILGGLKGPLMKVAQFLSTVPDALPAEYAEELAQLAGQRAGDGLGVRAPPHGERAGAGLAAPVRGFRPGGGGGGEPRAGASRDAARRHATSPASCNIPTWPSTVEADLRQLRLAMAVYHRMDNAIQHEDIYTELAERLREELDYLREAAQMRLYRLMLAATRRRASCREPIAELSHARGC